MVVDHARGGRRVGLHDQVLRLVAAAALDLARVVIEREVDAGDVLVAVCFRGAERREVPLDELPLPKPGPKGAEWILAYRAWRAE